MENKLLTRSYIATLILVLASTISAVDVKKDININNGSVEILDISFEDLKIIATIKSINASARSLPVDFYKSRVIGGNPIDPKYIRTILWCISPGEIIEVPCLWIGVGNYIIKVRVQKMDEAFQEVWWFLFFGFKVS